MRDNASARSWAGSPLGLFGHGFPWAHSCPGYFGCTWSPDPFSQLWPESCWAHLGLRSMWQLGPEPIRAFGKMSLHVTGLELENRVAVAGTHIYIYCFICYYIYIYMCVCSILDTQLRVHGPGAHGAYFGMGPLGHIWVQHPLAALSPQTHFHSFGPKALKLIWACHPWSHLGLSPFGPLAKWLFMALGSGSGPGVMKNRSLGAWHPDY
jgi:hypothetical protein